MSDSTQHQEAFREWCILELMGHRRLAGLVTEQQLGGSSFVRLDVPGDGDTWKATQLYSPSSVYCITVTTENVARRFAAGNQPAPVTKWDLPQLPERPPAKQSGDFDEVAADDGWYDEED